jgi:hypothetical protein
MKATMAVKEVVFSLVLTAIFSLPASGQSETTGEFWPAVDAHIQLPDHWRALVFAGLKKGEEFPYQQLNAGVGLGYQLKKISKPHPEEVNPDKEHYFLFGGGYERLQTFQSGKTSYENRLALQGTASFRPASRILLSDRNRVEFRWVNGTYSTRYRNQLYGEYDITIHKFRFNPYASAEVFYNGAVGSWNEEQYTAGIEWLCKHFLSIQTYYLRQNCTTCNPEHLNVGGLTLNLFF